MAKKDIVEKFGLTDRQFEVLKLYSHAKQPSLASAAEKLQCSAPNVAQILRTLESKKVIKRTGKAQGVKILAK